MIKFRPKLGHIAHGKGGYDELYSGKFTYFCDVPCENDINVRYERCTEMKTYRRLMNLGDWELVLQVLKERSITRVAASRGLDRSQLSRVIAGIEADLGVRLFERSGRSLVPTQIALEAARKIEPVAREMRQALRSLTASESAEEGSIRFGAMPGFMQSQIVPLLVEFQQNYPGIAFDVLADDDPQTFMRGQTDLMLYYGPVHNPSLIEHFVTRSAFIPCASPDYLRRCGAPLEKPSDLAQHAGILYTGRVRIHSRTLVLGGSEAPIRFKSMLRFNNILSAKQAAISGAGIVLDMPLHHCYEEILAGKLVPVLGGWHVPNLDNYIASTLEASRLRRVQIFVDWYIRRRREIEGAQKRRVQEEFGVVL